MGKIKLEYDFSRVLEKKLNDATTHVLQHVMDRIGISKIDMRLLEVNRELIKNYSVPIYTIRYDGVVMLRRFSTDVFTETKYRFQIDNFAPNK